MYRSGAVMAWNVFRFCTALRGLGSIMILLVLGVVGVSYYAVVLSIYGPALTSGGLDSFISLAVLLMFHALLVMLLWSYFSVVLTDPGGVPPNYRPLVDEERGDVDQLTGSEFTQLTTPEPTNTRVRYCRKCNHVKPPRSHHCSVLEFRNNFPLCYIFSWLYDVSMMVSMIFLKFSSIVVCRAANEPNEHEQDLVRVRLLRNICVREPFTNTYRMRFYVRVRLLRK
ncbi:putative protein S-acyltransferase [Helianthus annuus]|nr:putative protein S-acyltransferase [Helianthus annuus]